MKRVEMFTKENPRYNDICIFAQTVYDRELSLHILHFPDVLFAVVDDEHIYGCMGLNHRLTFPLFVNDPLLGDIISESGAQTLYCEQSVLAIHNYCIGLPVLISVVAKYAARVGLHKVVYAAIAVSQKTIEKLEFSTVTYGAAELSLLPPHMVPIYKAWYELHHPVCCILDTHNADMLCEKVLTRFSQKITLGRRLQSVFEDDVITQAA